ncbi:MAG: hypothetical protein ABI858_02645 [Pseudoxanthomonas sp.]
MNLFSRRQWIKLLRLPALALLVLAVLVNPVLAAVGDLHESSQGSGAHAQPGEAHDHESAADATTGGEEKGIDFLHALMHAAHCCGHLTAILSSAWVAPALLFSTRVPVPDFAAPHSPPRTDPFRPPIAI